MSALRLATITGLILDEFSSALCLHDALDQFAQICSDASGIVPDASFDSWADDTFLDGGMAINPQAAAYCIKDYQRSVMFIRGVYAAINEAQKRFDDTPIKILYAGCGPFATLLLPLIGQFKPDELDIHLLDIHQQSLDSVEQLITHFGFNDHAIKLLEGDACSYQHPNALHLIIAETMQKSLEQEPQFEVTANLAPQLGPQGIFIPEKIEVALCLAQWEGEKELFKRSNNIDSEALIKAGSRHPIGSIFTLLPEQAATQLSEASYNKDTSKLELSSQIVQVPSVDNLESYDALMFTRIQVFEQYHLNDYEADLTLPHKCYDLSPLKSGATYRVCYQLGNYPRFDLREL
jgi:hypothetical protein